MATKKISKNQEYRSMNEKDLLTTILDSEARLKKMVFSHAITPIDNPMAIRTLRREIAKMKTEQTRKQLES